ncbi:hypothetical protein HYW68_00470 [Candidatus Parcubacteria bacterium]|nr:hypothetical protein [Candidatus Parcubacteria bacterium]
MSGAYAVRTGAAADFSALLDFTLELEKQTVAVSAEIRQVEGTFYLRLIKLPTELLGALLPADRSVVPEITRYLNVWYSFKADSLNKYIPGFEIDRSAAGLDPAKQAKIKELVAKANLYHIQSVTRNELIGEVDVYRYLADLLTENLLALVREMAVVLDNRTFTAAEESQLRTVLAQAAKAKVQLWVGKDDHLLRRSHVSLDDVSAGASLLSTEINLEFTDFNQARIGAPEGALSLEAVIDEAISRQQRLTRDSRRITDLRQIQLALELFADSHRGQYPADIYSVTPCGRAAACGLASVDACGGKLCLAAVPTDPLDRTYAYAPHTTRRTIDAYHLGASLEDSGN